jgi:hypothetical protein
VEPNKRGHTSIAPGNDPAADLLVDERVLAHFLAQSVPESLLFRLESNAVNHILITDTKTSAANVQARRNPKIHAVIAGTKGDQ